MLTERQALLGRGTGSAGGVGVRVRELGTLLSLWLTVSGSAVKGELVACLWQIIPTQCPSWCCIHHSAKRRPARGFWEVGRTRGLVCPLSPCGLSRIHPVGAADWLTFLTRIVLFVRSLTQEAWSCLARAGGFGQCFPRWLDRHLPSPALCQALCPGFLVHIF